ncbi:uncharacterized protein LOC122507563 [Leptopilina heterotoma]|uniref:uncharacterized protein LOC122507563 n=1 Tax=Leptopilina heterotoma TaxID=63436 RepID=UPI001CA7E515|nr:uncharacterized protein LOC122507563 [Leptopilina heterotoma]XP_043476292.1 uncharacterized protein LOC122507563 [Leptopilina heterotoma]
MSVIIRLQNLAWSANALDIRQFFRGLSIPEGGVHIVGGELGDAFIAFSTDEDARQAMMKDGGKIKEMKIKLLLSSRTEMQKVIEVARQQSLSLQTFMQTTTPVPVVPAVPAKQQSPGEATRREKERDTENETSNKDRKERQRERSRSRSRDRDRTRNDRNDRRDRDRDRDRDRGRDRGGRRWERSRSRDRDRDRRDRNRRRRSDRSKSRDRTRSKDRDLKRNDRRKDCNDEENTNDIVCVGQFAKEKPKKPLPENGVWEVPPRTQQIGVIAPNILGAGIAALPTQDDRPSPFGNSVLAQQFSLNGLNGVGSLMSARLPNLGINQLSQLGNNSLSGNNGNSLNSLRGPREPWGDNGRMDSLRFQNRSGPFGSSQENSNLFNNSNNFRNRSNAFMNKVQELDSRRNPHAFQASAFKGPSFDKSDRSNDRLNRNPISRFGQNDQSSTLSTMDSGNCVEVRNMPLSATYSDVRHGFSGLFIRKDGLKLINDNHGNRVGIAYIKFVKNDAKEQALKSPKYVRGSEVEVLHLEESIFDKTVDSYPSCDRDNRASFSPVENDFPSEDVKNSSTIDDDNVPEADAVKAPEVVVKSSYVVLTELPSYAKEMDISNLFQDIKINDVFIKTMENSGSTKYLGYLHFEKIEDAEAALTKTLKIGPKQITASSISETLFESEKREYEEENGIPSESDCIIMRGLPYQSNDRDILDFFSDIGIVPHRIHMLLNQSGKPAGECFCEFDTSEEAMRAIGKNGLPLGKNVPTIMLVPRSKMLDTLGISDSHSAQIQIPHHYPMHHHHHPMHDMRPRFPGPMHYPRFGFGPRGPPPGMMGMPRHMMPPRHPGQMDHVDHVFGKPGCVVSLENVPFKASIDEIIEFFCDFEIKREQIIRRYNEQGMPTGDARICFQSPIEAQRALRELKLSKMRDRTIYMKIA